MNRLGRSAVCFVCGFGMATALVRAETVRERADWADQIENGVCHSCARLRQAAAVEFERASYGVRLLMEMGARWIPVERSAHRPVPVLARAIGRLTAADHECVRLKMWPATERSKTK